MHTVIIDTSVITDMTFANRPRHGEARALIRKLKEKNVDILVPMHALFEIAAATKNEMQQPTGGKLAFAHGGYSFDMRPIPIDEAFFKKYFSKNMPYLKAGDLIFVAMAKVDGVPLITEDNTQYIN